MAGINWDNVKDEAQKQAEEEKKKEEIAKEKKSADERKARVKQEEKKNAIVFESQRILGAYLVEKFSPTLKEYPNLDSFMRNFAPFTFLYSSCNGNYCNARGGGEHFHLQFSPIIEKNFLRTICGSVAQGYIEKTDLMQPSPNANGKKPETVSSSEFPYLFPEFRIVSKVVQASQTVSTSSPYDAVMVMAPENRPLMAIATERYLKKNPHAATQKFPVASGMPGLEYVLEAAKEFDIVDVKKVIEDIKYP